MTITPMPGVHKRMKPSGIGGWASNGNQTCPALFPPSYLDRYLAYPTCTHRKNEKNVVLYRSCERTVDRRADNPSGPLIPLLLASYLLYAIVLQLVIWLCWCTRGLNVLLVYSNSPHWQEYIEAHIIPQAARVNGCAKLVPNAEIGDGFHSP
ncbi:MAG: hypothetical protein KatS3mg105_5123 [Gemmatales bacterium]|nr:MAG: hypothetical protein KatS3mg105_5123 [Gemmatales bacterium]